MLLQRVRQVASPREQHDERDDGNDADVERQHLDVPQPEPKHLPDVVAPFPDHAVRTEQARERPAAQPLAAEDDHDERGRPAEDRGERAQHASVPAQEREHEGSEHGGADESERLRTCRHGGDEHDREQRGPPERRTFEHEHE